MEQAQDQSDNIYAMSDAELLQLDASQLNIQDEAKDAHEETVVPDSTDHESSTEQAQEGQVSEQAQEQVDPEATPEGEPTDAEAEIDYRGFYESVTKPFVANGKDIQVTDPNDMIRLMQQGAGYHKKMAAIKPMTRMGRLLEENGLMDEAKLSYLIDLHHKKPEAIASLIKDSGIDPLDLDIEKAQTYVPTVRQVDDTAVELQTVLDDLKENSQSYDRTITILGNQWDPSSRQTLAQYPELIRIIDSQVQDGTYDKINQIVEYERMMGRLSGVSDLHAYKQVGEQLFGNAQQSQPQQQATMVAPASTAHVAQPTTQALSTANAEQRKKAAAPPRQGVAETKQMVNPLTLSDAELLVWMSKNQ